MMMRVVSPSALLEDCEGTALVPELLGAWEIESTDVNASMLVEIGMNVGKSDTFDVNPGKLSWNPNIEAWKMIILFKPLILRFHVNFLECIQYIYTAFSMTYIYIYRYTYIYIYVDKLAMPTQIRPSNS